MKKTNLLLLSSLLSSSLFANDTTLQELKELPILKSPNIKLLDYKKLDDGWYFLKAKNMTPQGQAVPINLFTNKKYLTVGKVYDLDTKTEISFIDVNSIKKDAMFTIGNGEKEYFLFTDIECPYCINYDEVINSVEKELGVKAKIHVYFYPLSFHLGAHSFSQYVYSLEKDERQAGVTKLMKLISNGKLDEVIKITSEYNNNLYNAVLNALKSPNKQEVMLGHKYMTSIFSAFNIGLSKDMESNLKNIESLISKTPVKSTSSVIDSQIKIATSDIGVQGTPSVYDVSTMTTTDAFSILTSNGIINTSALDNIKNNGLSIPTSTYDKNKEDIYAVIATKCPACVSKVKDDNFWKNLEKSYNVNIILMPLRNSQIEKEEIENILSVKKEDRFSVLKSLMTKEKGFALKKGSIQLDYKDYMTNVQRSLINQTPTFVVPGKGMINPNSIK